MTLNAPKVIGASGASAPPASITSARPSRIAWNASPTAMVPDAQLIALVEFGPVNPNSMAMLQLAAPGNTASARLGLSPRGPSRRNSSTWDSANATPPSADPIIAPIRSASSRAGISSASASARRALATASCEKRSSRFARLASRWSCGWKSGISAAMRLLNGAGSNRVISRTAERRATRPAQRPSAAVPIGVTAPTPVITTRRCPFTFPLPPCGTRNAEGGTAGSSRAQRRPPACSAFRVPTSAFASCVLQRALHPRQGARRDAVDEHRSDDELGDHATDERPWQPGPRVLDRDLGARLPAAVARGQPPHDVHAARDTPEVIVTDLARRPIDGHARDPPRRVADRTEGAPRGHLDDAAARLALEKADPAVVRQQGGPALDVGGDLKDSLKGSADGNSVDGAHAVSFQLSAFSLQPSAES